LYEFQKLQVKTGEVAKFINILPLKEDLQSKVKKLTSDVNNAIKLGNSSDQEIYRKQLEDFESYFKEVEQKGYYQQIIPLD
jgi:glutamine cyclotransferase